MAKAKTTENAKKVPNVEPVGSLDPNNVATGGTNAGTNDANISGFVMAAGAPIASVAANPTDASQEHAVNGTGNLASPVDGDQLEIGIDLGTHGDVLVVAFFRDGIFQFAANDLPVADLISIIAAADDDDKRQIAEALKSYLVWAEGGLSGDGVVIAQEESAEDRYRREYPNLHRAMEEWKAKGKTSVPTMTIKSKVDGFWRAGIKHRKEVNSISMADLTAEKAELLLAEPNLVIELV